MVPLPDVTYSVWVESHSRWAHWAPLTPAFASYPYRGTWHASGLIGDCKTRPASSNLKASINCLFSGGLSE
jgi:hypothetical protein